MLRLFVLVFALFFVSCKDSQNAKEYDIQKALDKGNYDLVINALGDCSNKDTAAQKTQCYTSLSNKQKMDLGAAYYGKSGFTLIDLATDLADKQDSQSITRAVFKRLLDPNMQKGIDTYKQIMPSASDESCNYTAYKTLSAEQKQACLALNPILLKDLINGSETTTSSVTVSLENIVKFNNVLKTASPELSADALVAVIAKGDLPEKDDVNTNKTPDSIEATICAVNKTRTCDAGISQDSYEKIFDTSTNTNLQDINLTKITVTSKTDLPDAIFYRLVKKDKATTFLTTVSTIEGKFCDEKAVVKNCSKISDTDKCYPCPNIGENDKPKDLTNTVTTILQDEKLIESIALAQDSESSKTSTKKVEEFKTKVCGSKDCKIDQAKLLEYMNKGGK